MSVHKSVKVGFNHIECFEYPVSINVHQTYCMFGAFFVLRKESYETSR